MDRIGYSTGALARGDVTNGVELVRDLGLTVIELSALRVRELGPLTAYIERTDLSDFNYVSIHAPTDFNELAEEGVVATLERLAHAKKWPIVMHPDAVFDFGLWRRLGSRAFPLRLSADELAGILAMTPDAQVCFDIAH